MDRKRWGIDVAVNAKAELGIERRQLPPSRQVYGLESRPSGTSMRLPFSCCSSTKFPIIVLYFNCQAEAYVDHLPAATVPVGL